MKLAIMQPYLFPYLGYFQLVHSVDIFVVYDDVNYIKGGWINRNFILAENKKQRFTLPLEGASPNKLINQISICDGKIKLLESIRHNYSKAPQFKTVFPLLEDILVQKEKILSKFLVKGLQRICDYLGLHPQWRISSALEKDNTLRGQDKLFAICDVLKAKHYINTPGGKEIYARQDFAQRGIQLSFVQPKPVAYRQLGGPFVQNLSIVDALMFNTSEEIYSNMIECYELV